MRDPERLLDRGSSDEARLLASAVDEPPPPDLLGRTLDFVATAPPPGAAAGAAAGGAAKTGGLLGAIGIGAALGVLVVGGFELAGRSAAPQTPLPVVVSAPSMSVVAPVPEPPSIATVVPAVKSSITSPSPSAPLPSTLAAELALLDEARSALHAGDPAGARALLDRYAREIPRGQLGREAALLRAEVEGHTAIDAGSTDP